MEIEHTLLSESRHCNSFRYFSMNGYSQVHQVRFSIVRKTLAQLSTYWHRSRTHRYGYVHFSILWHPFTLSWHKIHFEVQLYLFVCYFKYDAYTLPRVMTREGQRFDRNSVICSSSHPHFLVTSEITSESLYDVCELFINQFQIDEGKAFQSSRDLRITEQDYQIPEIL